MISGICSISHDDGVRFDGSSIRSERVMENTEEYEGVRIKLIAYLGQARKSIQLDIAFGDRILPVRGAIDLPTILEMQPPHLRVYPLESIVSEKLETIVKLEDRNSRMNDFFDIYELATHCPFDGEKLQEAIEMTFKARGRTIPVTIPALLPEFYNRRDKQRLWANFLKRNRVRREELTLPEVAKSIAAFAMPVIRATQILAKFSDEWDPQERTWTKGARPGIGPEQG